MQVATAQKKTCNIYGIIIIIGKKARMGHMDF